MKRDECLACGSTMRSLDEKDEIHGGHHGSAFWCPNFEARRVRG